jgi:hypothetical protein
MAKILVHAVELIDPARGGYLIATDGTHVLTAWGHAAGIEQWNDGKVTQTKLFDTLTNIGERVVQITETFKARAAAGKDYQVVRHGTIEMDDFDFCFPTKVLAATQTQLSSLGFGAPLRVSDTAVRSNLVAGFTNFLRDPTTVSPLPPPKTPVPASPFNAEAAADDDETEFPARIGRDMTTDPVLNGEGAYNGDRGRVYVAQRVGTHEDIALYRDINAAGESLGLYGDPGVGKTFALRTAFPNLRTVIGRPDLESRNFFGAWVPDLDNPGSFRKQYGPVVLAMLAGETLFVDEVSRIPDAMTVPLFPLLDGTGYITLDDLDGEQIEAAPGFSLVFAWNHTLGTMDEALISRIDNEIRVRTDWKAAKTVGVPDHFIKVARTLNEMKDDPNNPLEYAPQFREGVRFRDQAVRLGGEYAWRSVLSKARDQDRPEVAAAIEVGCNIPRGSLKPLDTVAAAI